jgi:hypothetical protein
MVAWTVVLLLFPAALRLWTLMAHLVRRNGSAFAFSPTQGTNEAKRKHSNRCASAGRQTMTTSVASRSLTATAPRTIRTAPPAVGRRRPCP